MIFIFFLFVINISFSKVSDIPQALENHLYKLQSNNITEEEIKETTQSILGYLATYDSKYSKENRANDREKAMLGYLNADDIENNSKENKEDKINFKEDLVNYKLSTVNKFGYKSKEKVAVPYPLYFLLRANKIENMTEEKSKAIWEIIKYFIFNHNDIDWNKEYSYVLFITVATVVLSSGNLKDILENCKIDLNTEDLFSPLTVAVGIGDLAKVDVLLEYYKNVDKHLIDHYHGNVGKALGYAFYKGDPKIIEKFAEKGISFDKKIKRVSGSVYPISFAAISGKEDAINYALANRAKSHSIKAIAKIFAKKLTALTGTGLVIFFCDSTNILAEGSLSLAKEVVVPLLRHYATFDFDEKVIWNSRSIINNAIKKGLWLEYIEDDEELLASFKPLLEKIVKSKPEIKDFQNREKLEEEFKSLKDDFKGAFDSNSLVDWKNRYLAFTSKLSPKCYTKSSIKIRKENKSIKDIENRYSLKKGVPIMIDNKQHARSDIVSSLLGDLPLYVENNDGLPSIDLVNQLYDEGLLEHGLYLTSDALKVDNQMLNVVVEVSTQRRHLVDLGSGFETIDGAIYKLFFISELDEYDSEIDDEVDDEIDTESNDDQIFEEVYSNTIKK